MSDAPSAKRSAGSTAEDQKATPAVDLNRFKFISDRVKVVAEKLGMKPEEITGKLPHLATETDFLEFVASLPQTLSPPSIARYVDHTLLKPDAVTSDIDALCKQASTRRFASVCVNAGWIEHCYKTLSTDEKDDAPFVCAVVNFPLGAGGTPTKVAETQYAIKQGAREIDMVLARGPFLSGDYAAALEDIKGVVAAAAEGVEGAKNVPVKVIIESHAMTDEQTVDASILTGLAGAAFVKTSTGFTNGGASLNACALMKLTVGKEAKVKASGGVRDYATALQYLRIGVDRIGTSSGEAIVAGEGAATGRVGATEQETAAAAVSGGGY